MEIWECKKRTKGTSKNLRVQLWGASQILGCKQRPEGELEVQTGNYSA